MAHKMLLGLLICKGYTLYAKVIYCIELDAILVYIVKSWNDAASPILRRHWKLAHNFREMQKEKMDLYKDVGG